MGLSCGAVCPCRPGQLLDSLVDVASTVAEAGMPRPEEPSPIPTSPSGTTGWHRVLPGIGLALGAGLGLLIALLVSTAPAALVTGVTVGAGLGLIIGAIARAQVSGDGTEAHQ